MGALMSRFTQVASKNPYAWFPVARSADELTLPAPNNRMIAYPYTQYLNAVMETDQAAAVLLMSAGAARELGVPEDRQLHWWGGADAEEEAWFTSERPDFASCPALRVSSPPRSPKPAWGWRRSIIDFYSCSRWQSDGRDLGSPKRPRGLTVTGGLPGCATPCS
jgi:acetyl-CoA C-acetyltransferase